MWLWENYNYFNYSYRNQERDYFWIFLFGLNRNEMFVIVGWLVDRMIECDPEVRLYLYLKLQIIHHAV